MRLYHYTTSHWGLENLKKKRLKIALLDECNDPFELWGCWQGDPKLRAKIRSWKKEMARNYGILCLSATWHSPLMWSHYAERHKGICLGFDVPDEKFKQVQYTNLRVKLSKKTSEDEIASLLFLKYAGWSYEEEWRAWAKLEDKTEGHFFKEFGPDLTLREVYIGSFSQVSRMQVGEAIAYRLVQDEERISGLRICSSDRQANQWSDMFEPRRVRSPWRTAGRLIAHGALGSMHHGAERSASMDRMPPRALRLSANGWRYPGSAYRVAVTKDRGTVCSKTAIGRNPARIGISQSGIVKGGDRDCARRIDSPAEDRCCSHSAKFNRLGPMV
ncbi:MAG: hypothetical protein JWN16_1249 [Alphaproteobacteria bacterium]|nr:hypothetical protein [Alphaproteobacteria bacterium]